MLHNLILSDHVYFQKADISTNWELTQALQGLVHNT